MKRLKGPELKLSELKVPPFLSDLYWDLRDRRLLPLVGLVIVAIVAAPIVLGRGSDEEAPPAAPIAVAPAGGAAVGSGTAQLTVAQAKPGLRDYHKRFRGRTPTDPFHQRYTAPQIDGAQLGGGGPSSTSTTTKTSTDTSTSTDATGGGSTPGTETTESEGGGAPSQGGLRLFTFAADVKIVRSETKADGKVVHGKPTVHHRVVAPAALPSKKTAAIVYMGMDKNRLPLLLVSDAVSGVFGEGKCIAGSATCQLLEVEPGMPVTFVYGESGKVRYKVNVLKVEPVLAGKY